MACGVLVLLLSARLLLADDVALIVIGVDVLGREEDAAVRFKLADAAEWCCCC